MVYRRTPAVAGAVDGHGRAVPQRPRGPSPGIRLDQRGHDTQRSKMGHSCRSQSAALAGLKCEDICKVYTELVLLMLPAHPIPRPLQPLQDISRRPTDETLLLMPCSGHCAALPPGSSQPVTANACLPRCSQAGHGSLVECTYAGRAPTSIKSLLYHYLLIYALPPFPPSP